MSREYYASLQTRWAADNGKRQTPAITYQEGQALKVLAENDLIEMNDIFEAIEELLLAQCEDYFWVSTNLPQRERDLIILAEHQRAETFSKATYLLACYGHSIVKPLMSACDMTPPRTSNI